MILPTLISFSGGRSSAYMTYKMIFEQKIENYVVTFANTGKESNATLDFVNECDLRWKLNVVWLEYNPTQAGKFEIVNYETASRNGELFQKLLDAKSFLPNVVARFCTGELKVKVMKKYMQSLGYKRWNVAMGIRFDEPLRWARYIQNTQKEPFYYLLPLVEYESTKEDVMSFWSQSHFDLQLRQDEGNCDLCLLKGKAKLIRLMRENPAKAEWWIANEKRVDGRFRKRESYSDLLQVATSQQEIFTNEFDIDFPCHCNAD